MKINTILAALFAVTAMQELIAVRAQGKTFGPPGAEAAKPNPSDGNAIISLPNGTKLRAAFQDLEATAMADGLWIGSVAAENQERPKPFRIRADAAGRPASMFPLAGQGEVRILEQRVAYSRPVVVEEYSTGISGIRQDFVVRDRPGGEGPLILRLGIHGARAFSAPYGARLVMDHGAREMAYSRLHVTDAKNRVLQASIRVAAANEIAIQVDDSDATYPVRIDPTVSDADWIAILGFENVDDGDFELLSIAVFGSDLYVGGAFTNVAGVANTANIAKWDGNNWSSVGGGVNDYVSVLYAKGNQLYVGGSFTETGGASAHGIARWDGAQWYPLGEGVSGGVYAMAFEGQDLYVGGRFAKAGGKNAANIAKWSGGRWNALGTGTDEAVYALSFFNSDLYAGGRFRKAGGRTTNQIAKWNGAAWSALGNGVGDQGFPRQGATVTALAANSAELYVGGFFTEVDGNPRMLGVARWNGTSWSSLGSGLRDSFEYDEDTETHYVTAGVLALAVSGNDLYAGGFISKSGATPLSNLAKWNGSKWQAVGKGTNDAVQDLFVAGEDLYLAGYFTKAGSANAAGIARVRIGLPPIAEIAVEQPKGSELTNMKEVKRFGTVKIGSESASKTFLVRNPGTARLTGISVSLGGSHPNDFLVTQPVLNSLEPDRATTLKVSFSPKSVGERSAKLMIRSSDADEDPFSVTLSGRGTK